jgi:trans-aconitate 2-methyltransferase
VKEWNAVDYHRRSAPQFAWGMRVLERIALRGDEHALDAGCGSGRLTAELAKRLPRGRVVGCDLSENMTREAARTLGGRHEVVCANLLNLPFSAAFDLVFSTATFHWVKDHSRLFRGLLHVLKPGGRLEAQCGGERNLFRVHMRALAVAATRPFRSHFEDWTEPWEFAGPATTTRRLRDVGFGFARCWREPAPTTFPDAESYRGFLETVVMRPFLAHLSSAALRARFLDALTDAAFHDDPAFTLDYWRLNITAEKV